ncbi:hypothetical protein K438DRAFT_1976073 [Mycena galopus ATCC 62051]|nr:hypothetical protein K438DRAFT_1976073 [Mycena galopus ATCC 62051]
MEHSAWSIWTKTPCRERKCGHAANACAVGARASAILVPAPTELPVDDNQGGGHGSTHHIRLVLHLHSHHSLGFDPIVRDIIPGACAAAPLTDLTSGLQSINFVESREFRDLLLLLRDTLSHKDIPHRTKLTNLVIDAWVAYYAELKVTLKVGHFTLDNASNNGTLMVHLDLVHYTIYDWSEAGGEALS